jgi:hypothetical protein
MLSAFAQRAPGGLQRLFDAKHQLIGVERLERARLAARSAEAIAAQDNGCRLALALLATMATLLTGAAVALAGPWDVRYWISGPRKDGADRLYPNSTRPIEVDADVRDEYWREVRKLPVPR